MKKGREHTRVATLIDPVIDLNPLTCTVTAFQPARLTNNSAAQLKGRIHKCLYQLPPSADSLKKTSLLLLPIIVFGS